MKEPEEKKQDRDSNSEPAFPVRLPGFVIHEEIGLGDVIKRATYAMGISPCAGCEQRAIALNRWMKFTP